LVHTFVTVAPNDSNIVGQFLFENKFHLTGRGLILMGQIPIGLLSPGNLIHLKQGNNSNFIKISDVNVGHSRDSHFIGLHVDITGIITESELEKLIGTVFDITT